MTTKKILSEPTFAPPLAATIPNSEKMVLLNSLVSAIWENIVQSLAAHPQLLFKIYLLGWQNYLTFFQKYLENKPEEKSEDSFEKNLFFEYVKNSHSDASQKLQDLIIEISPHLDEKTANKLKFFSRQIME